MSVQYERVTTSSEYEYIRWGVGQARGYYHGRPSLPLLNTQFNGQCCGVYRGTRSTGISNHDLFVSNYKLHVT